MLKRCLWGVAIVALALTAAAAQEKPIAEPKAPALTTEQKQAVTILAQRIEIAQLKAQQAQAEFDRAREEIATLLRSLQVQGYTLDLQKMEYVKTPEPKKEPEKK